MRQNWLTHLNKYLSQGNPVTSLILELTVTCMSFILRQATVAYLM